VIDRKYRIRRRRLREVLEAEPTGEVRRTNPIVARVVARRVRPRPCLERRRWPQRRQRRRRRDRDRRRGRRVCPRAVVAWGAPRATWCAVAVHRAVHQTSVVRRAARAPEHRRTSTLTTLTTLTGRAKERAIS